MSTVPDGKEQAETPVNYTYTPAENVQEGIAYRDLAVTPTPLFQRPIGPLTTSNAASGYQGPYGPPRGQYPPSAFPWSQPGWNASSGFQSPYMGQAGQTGYPGYPVQSTGFQPQYAPSTGQRPAYGYTQQQYGATHEQTGASEFSQHDTTRSGQTAQSEFHDLYEAPEHQEATSGFNSAALPQISYQTSASAPARQNFLPAYPADNAIDSGDSESEGANSEEDDSVDDMTPGMKIPSLAGQSHRRGSGRKSAAVARGFVLI